MCRNKTVFNRSFHSSFHRLHVIILRDHFLEYSGLFYEMVSRGARDHFTGYTDVCLGIFQRPPGSFRPRSNADNDSKR